MLMYRTLAGGVGQPSVGQTKIETAQIATMHAAAKSSIRLKLPAFRVCKVEGFEVDLGMTILWDFDPCATLGGGAAWRGLWAR